MKYWYNLKRKQEVTAKRKFVTHSVPDQTWMFGLYRVQTGHTHKPRIVSKQTLTASNESLNVSTFER